MLIQVHTIFSNCVTIKSSYCGFTYNIYDICTEITTIFQILIF